MLNWSEAGISWRVAKGHTTRDHEQPCNARRVHYTGKTVRLLSVSTSG
jgi:hypothetical protein